MCCAGVTAFTGAAGVVGTIEQPRGRRRSRSDHGFHVKFVELCMQESGFTSQRPQWDRIESNAERACLSVTVARFRTLLEKQAGQPGMFLVHEKVRTLAIGHTIDLSQLAMMISVICA